MNIILDLPVAIRKPKPGGVADASDKFLGDPAALCTGDRRMGEPRGGDAQVPYIGTRVPIRRFQRLFIFRRENMSLCVGRTVAKALAIALLMALIAGTGLAVAEAVAASWGPAGP